MYLFNKRGGFLLLPRLRSCIICLIVGGRKQKTSRQTQNQVFRISKALSHSRKGSYFSSPGENF